LITPVKAKPEQAEGVFNLWISNKDAFRLDSSYSDSSNARKYIDWLRCECAAGRVWVVIHDDKVVGLAVMHSAKSEIWYLAVEESQRKKGIGLSIVGHMQSINLELEAEVRTAEAKKLLEKCGFVHNGRNSKSGDPILSWKRE